MNRYYHYPDGTDSDVRPKDGEICKVPGQRRGEFSSYEWDDSGEEWHIIPEDRTPMDVIEKTKEIMKIGKYANLRPKKERYFWNENEYDMYPYGPAMLSGQYPYTKQQEELKELESTACETTSRYREIMKDVRTRHHGHAPIHETFNCDVTDDGTWYVPCDCGRMYSETPNDHFPWCKRRSKRPGIID